MSLIKRILIIGLFSFIMLGSVATDTYAGPRFGFYVGVGSVKTVKPGPRYVWVDGHYKRTTFGKLVWVPGHWKKV